MRRKHKGQYEAVVSYYWQWSDRWSQVELTRVSWPWKKKHNTFNAFYLFLVENGAKQHHLIRVMVWHRLPPVIDCTTSDRLEVLQRCHAVWRKKSHVLFASSENRWKSLVFDNGFETELLYFHSRWQISCSASTVAKLLIFFYEANRLKQLSSV